MSRQLKKTYKMKKINLNGKLSLKKETIAKLNDEQMKLVNGGACTIQGSGCNPPLYSAGYSNCPVCTGPTFGCGN